VTLPQYAYFEGKIVPYSEAKVGVATHALNYGTGAFAGLRGYWNPEEEQLFLFRPIDHFTRLLNSARILCAEVDYTPESLRDIAVELMQTEGLHEDCYLRPLIYKADEVIGVRLHDLRDEVTMFIVPFTRYVDRDDGAHVTFSSWRQRHPRQRQDHRRILQLGAHQDRCRQSRVRRSAGPDERRPRF
jgi:branched-chain amino acid aminotransferase